MRFISTAKALAALGRLKDGLRRDVANYERQARSCSTCKTPGACCLDEHFVNVRISRLEAAAIVEVIDRLPPITRAGIIERTTNSATDLTKKEHATFACPLYERGTGCLVHHEAKPVPCIVHACYERREDLPPDALQDAAELAIDDLSTRVYGHSTPLDPLPIAVQAAILRTRRMKAITTPAINHPQT